MEQTVVTLINNFSAEEEEHIKYAKYIDVHTYRKYFVRTIIILNDDPGITWGEIFLQYPGLERVYNTMCELIETHHRQMTEYLNSIIQYWEDDLTNRN